MTKRIQEFLSLIRGNEESEEPDYIDTAYPIIEEIFTQGNCRNLARMLQMIEPEGRPIGIKNKDVIHVVFLLNGRMWDITGDVTDKYKDEIIRPETIVDLSWYSWEVRGPVG